VVNGTVDEDYSDTEEDHRSCYGSVQWSVHAFCVDYYDGDK